MHSVITSSLILIFGATTLFAAATPPPFSDYRLSLQFGEAYVSPASFNRDLTEFHGFVSGVYPDGWYLPWEVDFPPRHWLHLIDFTFETNLPHRFNLRLSVNFGKASSSTSSDWRWEETATATGNLKRTDTFFTFQALGELKYYPPLPILDRWLYLGAGSGYGWLSANGSVNYQNIFYGDDYPTWYAITHHYTSAMLAASACLGLEATILGYGFLYLEGGLLWNNFGELEGRSSFEVFTPESTTMVSGQYQGRRPQTVDFIRYAGHPAGDYNGGSINYDLSQRYLKLGVGARF